MASGESIPGTLRLSLVGQEAIHEATEAARDFAAVQRTGETVAAKLAIMVEELVTNLFEHGGSDRVEIELARAGDSISLTISDQGEPFDPRSASQPAVIPDRGGGAGLALVRAWASASDYVVGETGNRLTISLPLKRR